MLDFRFLDFIREGSLFYDAPDSTGAEKDFRAGQSPGPGWTVDRGREWTVCTPPVLDIPEQGWKIHVAATLGNAAELLDIVAPYCVERGLLFKYINNREILGRRGSKYGDRTASGKFITIYPPDVTVLEQALNELEELIGGAPAPNVLSDLRWRNGPLFVRYGGFVLQLVRADNGRMVPAMRDPDGQLVPDVRRPSFRPPKWAPLPPFLASAMEQRQQGKLSNFPYKVYQALHFSNGGGVYRARDTRTGREVLVKEARPLAGLDASGDDAVIRMEREHWALEQLTGLPFVPALLDYRSGHEHRYLVREFVDGEPLIDMLQARHPFVLGEEEPAQRAAYRDWALGIIDQVATAVRAMHERGVVFGDLHPGNILVTADGSIRFIDMETSTPVADGRPQSMGALGFHAPGHLKGADTDLYALAVLRLSLFTPLPQIVQWGVGKIRQLIELAAREFDLPADVVAELERSLSADALGTAADHSLTWPSDLAGSDIRQRIATSILDVATPERDDRLYPGDATQFLVPGGGTTFAHGAAGVLWVLARGGYEVPESHVQWLVDHAMRLKDVGPGFFNGLAGVAYALEELGRHAEATTIMDRAIAMPVDQVDGSVADGWAGLGLAALHLAEVRADPAYLAVAEEMGRRLGERDPEATDGKPRVGLFSGRTGVAMFLLRLHDHTGDRAHLERAIEELRSDARLAGLDSLQADRRLGPGLAGTAGMAMVTAAILRERPDAELRRLHDVLLGRVRSQFLMPGGLFTGRAGAVLAMIDQAPAADRLAAHVDALSWEAVAPEPGQVHFIGTHGYRLSTDLATGSAGVLLALDAAAEGTGNLLPFVAYEPRAVLAQW
ncbi:class III lanthionine synthetase LanKC [Actinoplanes sp. NPDC051859]|uniref:class III lanthionine synthetase LanKC n=1 Tax=Actinoplanes sp. NPDC051859 TaxID=3363909 RepID=UPI00378A4A99